MIPRKLTIEGVYSYQKRQVIDFSTLSEAGIFGVFGHVGSGKSAVLEAMTYALYGQIERLNDKEQRGYNIMNLQSSALYIDFEFSQDGLDYRFAVSAKRQKKDFNKIQSPERAGYKKQGGQWIPLPDEGIRGGITAEKIIGLNYEHFRRTVIIPQGKFQEFIQLPPSQRTGMIETLFGLQRFNLSANCNFLLARSREELSFIEGRLDDLVELNPEDLKTLEQSARNKAEELKRKTIEKKELNQQLLTLNEYEKILKSLEKTHKSLEILEQQKEKILKEDKLLKQSQRMNTLFTPLLEKELKIHEDLKELNKESDLLGEKMTSVEKVLKEGEKYWNRLKNDQEKYSDLRKTFDSLKAQKELEEIRDNEEQDKLQAGIIANYLKNLKSEFKILNEKKKEQSLGITGLEKLLEREKDLSELDDWYRQKDMLSEKSYALRKRRDELINEETEKHHELSRIKSLDIFSKNETAGTLEIKILEELRKQEAEHEKKEMLQKQKEQDSSRRLLLSKMSEDLQEGQACPLCGSEHHPQIYEGPAESEELKEQESLKKQRQILLKQKEDIMGILPSLKYLEQERFKTEEDLKHVETSAMKHISSFKWPFLKAEEKEKFILLKKELNQHRAELKELRQKSSALDEEYRRTDSQIREKETELMRLELKTEHLAEQKKALNQIILPEHKDKPADRDAYESLRKRLENLDRDYFRIKSGREGDEQNHLDLKNKIQSNNLLKQRYLNELAGLDSDIQNQLLDQSLSGRDDLKIILSRLKNREADQERIDNFHKSRTLLLEQSKSLQKSMDLLEKDSGFKEKPLKDPRDLELRIAHLEDELQGLLTGTGALGKQIEDLKSKLKLRETLTRDLEKQKTREENLKELSSLFKGGRFVQYIASVYMQEMCQLANSRFSTLTGRSLELEFQDNQIMVRDFLNEGRLRHIKTLSGGQSFQAALCLALALAEQTGRGKGSFFFLDEGFGSLDKESLATVMTTLRTLSREGRIIGVISHVEEMQQDLDVWIRIKRDPEKGSRVQYSWKSSTEENTGEIQ